MGVCKTKRTILERDWEKDIIIFSLTTGKPVAVGHAVSFYQRWRNLLVYLPDLTEDR